MMKLRYNVFMLSAGTIMVAFLLILFGGWVFEGTFFKKASRKKFNARNYLIFLISPLVAVSFACYHYGLDVVYIFVLASVVGIWLEYTVDKQYLSMFGARLWKYYRYNIDGNTSWLAMPLWGLAGVTFLVIAKFIVDL